MRVISASGCGDRLCFFVSLRFKHLVLLCAFVQRFKSASSLREHDGTHTRTKLKLSMKQAAQPPREMAAAAAAAATSTPSASSVSSKGPAAAGAGPGGGETAGGAAGAASLVHMDETEEPVGEPEGEEAQDDWPCPELGCQQSFPSKHGLSFGC
jgi:hypothetical protein